MKAGRMLGKTWPKQAPSAETMITREAELIQEHNSMSKTRTAGFNAPALRLAGKNKEQNFVCTKET